MTLKVKQRLVFYTTILLVYTVIMSIYYNHISTYTLNLVKNNIENILLSNRALGDVISDFQKKEIIRLQKEGILDSEYFSPSLQSSSFIIKKLNFYTSEERKNFGLPPFIFKYASLNPTNLENTASNYEMKIIDKFKTQQLDLYTEEISEDNANYLYLAMPGKIIEKKCLQCHGNPKNAPQDMIEIYGNKNGFGFEVGDLSSIISVKVPVDSIYAEKNKNFLKTSLIILVLFFLLFYISENIKNSIEKRDILLSNAINESNIDSLTKLLNRKSFEKQFIKEYSRAKRDNKYFALLMIDIDLFKQYNDTYGHQSGDTALKVVSRSLEHSFKRSGDIIFRMGGEEFAVILSDVSSEKIINYANKACNNIPEQNIEHRMSSVNKFLTISVGIAILHELSSCTLNEAYEASDKALYRAKNQGRNRVETTIISN